jgi:hypothetical protein
VEFPALGSITESTSTIGQGWAGRTTLETAKVLDKCNVRCRSTATAQSAGCGFRQYDPLRSMDIDSFNLKPSSYEIVSSSDPLGDTLTQAARFQEPGMRCCYTNSILTRRDCEIARGRTESAAVC